MNRLRVGLLSNPSAAFGSSHRTGRQVARLLHLAGISVVDISGPTAHVARARAMEIRDSLTALVVVGGDGTVSLGAEIVADTPVRLGIVPAGSGNDFARWLGLPVDDPEAATRVLLAALSRPALSIDALEVTSAGDSTPHHRSLSLGNVNLGFDAVVNARANSARRGRSRYTAAVLRELPAFRPFPYWIEVDGGERTELDATLLTACNTGIFGGGMRLSPSSRIDDGTLELAALQGLSRTQLLRFFPRVFRGAHLGVEGFSLTGISEVTVGLRSGRSLRAYADGEARALLPVTVRVLPGAVRLLADAAVLQPAEPADPAGEEIPRPEPDPA